MLPNVNPPELVVKTSIVSVVEACVSFAPIKVASVISMALPGSRK